ncbi:MAG TPA: tetratricopeptide repeat protein, partial [Candidatus Udaeobacter sp.]|nr:tetratricopeptide repeat protein [Candidatus Udaeobacter sp.]
YRAAVRLQPESAIHHGALGHALRQHGNNPEAEAECRRALALDPGLALARYDLALALQAQGRREEAIAEVNALLRQKPDNPDALRLRDQLTGTR